MEPAHAPSLDGADDAGGMAKWGEVERGELDMITEPCDCGAEYLVEVESFVELIRLEDE